MESRQKIGGRASVRRGNGEKNGDRRSNQHPATPSVLLARDLHAFHAGLMENLRHVLRTTSTRPARHKSKHSPQRICRNHGAERVWEVYFDEPYWVFGHA